MMVCQLCHELSCVLDRVDTPSYDILRQIYVKSPILFIKGNTIVEASSPYCKSIIGLDECELIGTKHEISNESDDTIVRKSKNGTLLRFKRFHVFEDYFIEIPE